MSQNARVGKSYPKNIISEVTVAPVRFSSQDISSWKKAVDSARHRDNPRRRELHELFDNIEIDGKIVTVKQRRIGNVLNKTFQFVDRKTKKVIESVQEGLIDLPVFDDLITGAMERFFRGHVCLELVPGGAGISAINLIPFSNVIPERGELLLDYMQRTGIPFRGENADPMLAKHLIEWGKPKDYGLLMSAAQYVIYKRGGFGDWAQFAEIFGMPFRVGKYDQNDNSTRLKLLQALAEMGGAGYAVIPEGSSISFENANYGSGQSGIFKDLIEVCNDEIAQIVLGGTMTTSNGSSKSQSETHKEGEEEITKSDLKLLLKWLNGDFKERLIPFGYTESANGIFTLESTENLSLKDRIEIDTKVAQQVPISKKYWYETYGVHPPESTEDTGGNQTPPPPATDADKKKTLVAKLSAFHQACSCSFCNDTVTLNPQLAASPLDEVERLASLIYQGKLKNGKIDKKLLQRTARELMAGIFTGYLRQPDSDAFTAEDKALVAMMRENVFVFSGFKAHALLKQASQMLLDDKGNIVPFAEFKRMVQQLDNTYNVNYLNAEYNHAVASGQMASKWISFQSMQDQFPNLIYQTAGDDRVRPTHVALDGTVKPINDSFWLTNYPPNGWNCRCDVDSTDAAVTPTPSVPAEPSNKGLFNNNVGIDGVVFPKSHPYFSEATEAQSKRIIDQVTRLMSTNG